ncbi:MAG: hypothetical protein EOM92_19655 [Gammaproteobacteria bacterium]|nr:hypothetical protein [Gammaproteobacteria bacterium]
MPTSQKDLPIGIVVTLSSGLSFGGIDLAAPVSFYLFNPRPESIQYNYPTRGTVIQTFDGGYVDDFGEGLVDIVVSGHTGWGQGVVMDGFMAFLTFRELVIRLFHQLRAAQAAAGLPIENVKMYWVDTLNVCVYEVYPISLMTQKNRQRPLLYQYTLRMTGIKSYGVADAIGGFLT